jgi:FixJ family two-component response regulator
VASDRPAIYVVDDDASVRKAIRRVLLPLGLPVIGYASAEDFVEQCPHGSPGCLILDQKMPGLSGLQLQRHLAASKWALPVIFISAQEDEQIRTEAIEQGAISFLRKPFDQDALRASVRMAVSRQ